MKTLGTGSRVRLASGLLLLAVTSTLTTGCSLDFANDGRVSLISPREMAVVSLPAVVSWRSAIPAGSGFTYAVFVDRTPLRPGQSVRALADETCKHTPGCPNAAWLADRGVFLSDSTSVKLPYLPTLVGKENRDLHTLTLVVLDSHQRRSGEGAWSVQFRGGSA